MPSFPVRTMAFLSTAHPLQVRKRMPRIQLCRAEQSHASSHRLTPHCMQTPVSARPPRKRSASVNFFENPALSREPPCQFPTNIDELLRTVSAADRFVPIWHERPLLSPSPRSRNAQLSAVLWTPDNLRAWLRSAREADSSHTSLAPFLAYAPSVPSCYFAVDVSISAEPPVTSDQQAYPLRGALASLQTETEAALVAHAKAILSWHASSRYCSRCGSPTIPKRAGTARACGNEACPTRNIYPRVMPSVLALVLRKGGSQVLLGRKASWPPRRYSVLAGFAEIFESLEEAVAREVKEETGVAVERTSIQYHSSQPWPSAPHASLMSGFRAYVADEGDAVICVDKDELEDARWFEKTWLRDNLDDGDGTGAVTIPGPTSLARRLILEWLAEPDSQHEELPSTSSNSED